MHAYRASSLRPSVSRLTALIDRQFPLRGLARRNEQRIRKAVSERPVTIRMERDATDPDWFHLQLRKERGGITIAFNAEPALSVPAWLAVMQHRPAVIVRLFAATRDDIRRCRADVSDRNSAPGFVSFCSHSDGAILIPDSRFFLTRGYAAERGLASPASTPWQERSDVILWRGAASGHGALATETMSPDDADLRQRVRMCLLLRGIDGTSARIVNIVDDPGPLPGRQRLEEAGIFGSPLPAATWLSHKYAIDIDGYGNAWDNLLTRLLFGCCVIKIASPSNCRQWYYGDLVAWTHYVPVRADMSDLLEKIDWCRSHPGECEAIAEAGKALAHAMTFEREMKRGIETLERMLPSA